MSVGLDFLMKLSFFCKEELSRSGRNNEVKQTGEVTANLVCGKSILKSDRNDRRLRRRNHVKFEDDSSEWVVPKRKNSVCETYNEPPAELASPPKKPEESDLPPSNTKNYCAPCNLQFSKRLTYLGHLLTDKHLGLIRCELCVEKMSYNEMENHLNTVHSTSSPVFKTVKRLDDGSFHCTKCDCIFTMFHLYRRHVGTQAHKGRMCRQCNFRSQSAKEMEEHFLSVHGNRKSQICKLCGTGFSSLVWLERHMEAAHFEKKSFPCSTCGATFSRQDNLRRHEAERHTVERPFSCNICSLSFKYKRNLVQHMAVHAKDRHQCAVCFKSFEDEIDLENHERIHTGTLFNCMVCGMSFPNYKRREIHFTKHLNPTRKKKEEAEDLKVDDSFCEYGSSVLGAPVEESAPPETSLRENREQVECVNIELQKGEKPMSQSGNSKKCSFSPSRNLSSTVTNSGQSNNQNDVPLPSRNKVKPVKNFIHADKSKVNISRRKNLVNETVKRTAPCKKEVSEASMEMLTLSSKNSNTVPMLHVKGEVEGNVSSHKKTRVTFRECVEKLQDPSDKEEQNCLLRGKSPVLEIQDSNVSCDKICSASVERTNAPVFSVKNPENSSFCQDLLSGRIQSETAKNACSGKRNYANAFEKDLKQVPTLELPVKRRKKSVASKENSPVSQMESFSERVNSPAKIFKECKLNMSKCLNSPENQTENLPGIPSNETNISRRSTGEENQTENLPGICSNETNISRRPTGEEQSVYLAGRSAGSNNLNARPRSSTASKNLARKVPKVGSKDLNKKKCDSNSVKVRENAIFPKALGTEECLPDGYQILEMQEDGWSKKDGIIMELKGDDLVVIDKPYYIHEATLNSKTNRLTVGCTAWDVDPSTVEEAVFIDSDNLTEIDDLFAIPVDNYVTEVDPLACIYPVPDTDSGVSLLNAEDVTQDQIFTFTASGDCLETPVVYKYETVKAFSKVPRKKRTNRRGKKSKYACVNEKKVLVKNLRTDSDDFCLPEFVIEEDSEQS